MRIVTIRMRTDRVTAAGKPVMEPIGCLAIKKVHVPSVMSVGGKRDALAISGSVISAKDHFSYKIGRRIAAGRLESGKSILIPLYEVRSHTLLQILMKLGLATKHVRRVWTRVNQYGPTCIIFAAAGINVRKD